MQKAVNRFWDWLFHPGIRWYHYPKGKASWFRYPSPGNTLQKQQVYDYKTPYEYSQYNIRYKKPAGKPSLQHQGWLIADGLAVKIIDKLRFAGLLQNGNNTAQEIQQAKKKFLTQYGVPVETKVYRNDFDIVIPEGTNRESYRQFIENQFKQSAQLQADTQNPNSNRKFIQEPEVVEFESLDMFTAPNFQQTRIEVDYKLDNHANQNAKRGYIDIKKGQKSFWKALDNSNDAKNIENVQRAVGDYQPNNFKLQNTKIEFQLDSKGNVVDVDPKTRSL